jgi:uncharacterized protein YcfL
MKKLGFLLVGTASLALAACGSNEADTLNETQAQNMESEALNNLAAEAANAEIEALGNQQQRIIRLAMQFARYWWWRRRGTAPRVRNAYST